jgi:hypothetical protein
MKTDIESKTLWSSNLKQHSEQLFDKDKIAKRISFTGIKQAPEDRDIMTIEAQSTSTKLAFSNRKSALSSIQREKAKEQLRERSKQKAKEVIKNTVTQE